MYQMKPVDIKFNFPIYFIFVWSLSALLCIEFIKNTPTTSIIDYIHAALLVISYGFIFQLPAMLAYALARKRKKVAIALTVTLSLMAHLFIISDSRLFELYGFHINGFVWNLITTAGGIASLEADQSQSSTIILYVVGLLCAQMCFLFVSRRFSKLKISMLVMIALFAGTTLIERAIYGVSKARLYGPVLERADAIPFYQPTKINSLLHLLGLQVKKHNSVKIGKMADALQYPKHALNIVPVSKPLNILVLASESMRSDLMNPEIMPNASDFAKHALQFKNHYSGGNGTREGLFGLFYGIHGAYWDLFLRNRKGPVLFNVLNQYGYQYFIHTSASFTYPEFDQTIFNTIPKENLVEHNSSEPWQRDEQNTTEVLNKIANRDKSKPFFGFIFFEATHARYSFSDKDIIRNNYLKTLDYTNLTRKQLAKQSDSMYARYANAAHGIDRQLGRIITQLRTSGDLDNTLLVITGDHGEEFMERGRWGHNSAFTDWQVKVPMIVSLPNTEPKVVSERTSHLDLAPTILSLLGVSNPVKDYSLGTSLLSPKQNRDIIVSSWSDIGLINDLGKLVIPFKSTTQHKNLAMNLQDRPVPEDKLIKKMKSNIFNALTDAKYYRHKG